MVTALAVLPNGDIVAGGLFTTAGGTPASRIARWDGASWSPIGPGLTGSAAPLVFAIQPLPNGDLIVGGDFTSAGGVPANFIARWSSAGGGTWTALGAGVSAPVTALTILPGGDLAVGGYFTTAGGVSANRIARWNGSAWSGFGAGVDSIVYAVTTLPAGDLVAGGAFGSSNGIYMSSIARWSGAAWVPMGAGLYVGINGTVTSFAKTLTGDLIAGGSFSDAGGTPANFIARRSSTTGSWSSLGEGMNGGVLALLTLPNGDLIAGGTFTRAGAIDARYIARWDGSSWSALGAGMSTVSLPPVVRSLATIPTGVLFAGGLFDSAGGETAQCIARWTCTCPSDFDGDGFVTGDDFDAYVENFATGEASCDFDGNGFVNGDDFDAFVLAFEAGC